jgi:hypothetical protein
MLDAGKRKKAFPSSSIQEPASSIYLLPEPLCETKTLAPFGTYKDTEVMIVEDQNTLFL